MVVDRGISSGIRGYTGVLGDFELVGSSAKKTAKQDDSKYGGPQMSARTVDLSSPWQTR